MISKTFIPGKLPQKPRPPNKPVEFFTQNHKFYLAEGGGVFYLKNIHLPIDLLQKGYSKEDIKIQVDEYNNIEFSIDERIINKNYDKELLKFEEELNQYKIDISEYNQYIIEYDLFMNLHRDKNDPIIKQAISDAKDFLKRYNEI